MKLPNIPAILAAALLATSCQTDVQPPTVAAPPVADVAYQVTDEMKLWPGVAPGSEGWTQEEIFQPGSALGQSAVARNVVDPTLTAYLPDPENATGSAVIVAPGGGFMMLMMDSEGHDVAKRLAEQGIAAFVLKYRLSETPVEEDAFTRELFAMLIAVRDGGPDRVASLGREADLAAADAIEAIKLVRSRAEEWRYSPDRVGLMGFSAGAFVTTRVLENPDRTLHPNFAAPIYGGTFDPETGIPEDLPPMFITVAGDDDLLAEATVAMVNRLRGAGYRPTFHLFPSGGHGFGLSKQGKASDHWIDAFFWWMEEEGHLKR